MDSRNLPCKQRQCAKTWDVEKSTNEYKMDPNHPPDPTQGTPTHPGPGQDWKSSTNRPKIDEKSIKSDFPAKSAENF